MSPQLKALLLGVSLKWTPDPNGGLVHDKARQDCLTKALDRLDIDVELLEPDTIDKMLPDAEGMLEWLCQHGLATITLGYWCVRIESKDFADVDYEQHDYPFELGGAVESFAKSERVRHHASDRGWYCEWYLG